MTFSEIVQGILGVAEEVVPVFIHDPKTQQLTGVVITTVNQIASEYGIEVKSK